jgi:hypothetical protein
MSHAPRPDCTPGKIRTTRKSRALRVAPKRQPRRAPEMSDAELDARFDALIGRVAP